VYIAPIILHGGGRGGRGGLGRKWGRCIEGLAQACLSKWRRRDQPAYLAFVAKEAGDLGIKKYNLDLVATSGSAVVVLLDLIAFVSGLCPLDLGNNVPQPSISAHQRTCKYVLQGTGTTTP